jgi:hypothetical protein
VTICSASGPWTAISAVASDSSVTSTSNGATRLTSSRATSGAFDAFATTRKSSSASRYTTRSSSTSPNSFVIME